MFCFFTSKVILQCKSLKYGSIHWSLEPSVVGLNGIGSGSDIKIKCYLKHRGVSLTVVLFHNNRQVCEETEEEEGEKVCCARDQIKVAMHCKGHSNIF